jgi:hypothetical protein
MSRRYFITSTSIRQRGNADDGAFRQRVTQIAVAYVRKFLDGGVGDTLDITKAAAANTYTTLNDFLNAVKSASIRPFPRASFSRLA